LSLYRIGAFSAVLAAGLALIQMLIEIVGVGIRGTPVPDTVSAWFALLRADRLLGFTELTGLQVPIFILLVPMFLALHIALRRFAPGPVTTATVFALMGVTVYLASNTVFSMVTLSDQYAAAMSDAERAGLLAAGQAMLATYDGPGLDVGIVLVMVATLILSATMWRSGAFDRVTASMGLLAPVVASGYYLGVAFPANRIFLLEAAGVLLVVWGLLVARRLNHMAGRVWGSAAIRG
jgi:hypothetical protein